MSQSVKPILDVKDLSISFTTRDGAMLDAVRGANFEIYQGECLALVGESGSGKSVSMMALMGLLPPNGQAKCEKMSFDGVELSTLTARQRRGFNGRRLSMIFQDPTSSLNPSFTIGFQMVEMIRQHQSVTKAEALQEAVRLLGRVGIASPETRLKNWPHQLSGGMLQRVMIAMMISTKPQLLIADEPTSALDVTIQAQIIDLLDNLRVEQSMGLILITHDIALVSQLADKICVYYAGSQVEYGDCLTVLSKPNHPYTKALLETRRPIEVDEIIREDKSDYFLGVDSPITKKIIQQVRVKKNRLLSIEGSVPSLANMPKGCRFHPRCPQAKEICRQQEPIPSQGVACHFPLS